MVETRSKLRYVRFGAFEVDLQTEELRKNGVKLKFAGQPFQVLAILLEHPDELVTREELQNRVWPDVIVDVERNLNTAINKVRETLGDPADRPRFIETLPRRGYRFIAAVETSSLADRQLPDSLLEKSSAAAVETLPEPEQQPLQQQENKSKKRGKAVFAIAAALLLLAGGLWYFRKPPSHPRITAYTQITHDGLPKRLAGTDGNRVYFSEDLPVPIAQVSAAGGDIARIPVAFPNIMILEDVSPDGSSFLIQTSENGIDLHRPQWSVPVLGGSMRRLPDAAWANFLPDGKSVVYSTPEGEVWAVANDGTGPRKLAKVGDPALKNAVGPVQASYLAFSSDGRTFRFTSHNALWEISANEANPHRLFPNWSPFQCCGRWTPDGNFFLFLVHFAGSLGAEIWAIDERRSLMHRSAPKPFPLATGPLLWSAPIPGRDGKTIFAEGFTARGELQRFDAKTGHLVPFLGGISAQGLAFAGDGKHLAYVSFPDGILWKADWDGSNPVRLTDPPMNPINPRWSADGTRLAFTDLLTGWIYTVEVAGGRLQRLLPEDNSPQSDPNWSSDGKKILFASGTFFDPKAELRILNLASRQVTTVPGSVGTYSPRWSPDGRFIAALRHDGLGFKVFDIEKQAWHVPTSVIGPTDFPAWSHDSQFLYFIRSRSDRNIKGVYRLRARGGTPERIVDLSHFQVSGWWASWLGIDPTDAPLLLKDMGTDDIYALTLER